MANDKLNEYGDAKRLAVYKMLVAACGHMYSKGQLQVDKFKTASAIFADLAKNDPLFLAHFTAWAAKQDNKDQKVLSVFFNALSDADGLPFFKGSELCKPNLRQVSHAIFQKMDVPLALRVTELAQTKFGVTGMLNESRHFPTALKTAVRKYLLYREANQGMLRGIRNAGLTSKFCNLYRSAGIPPSDYVVGLFKWNQTDGRRWKDLQVAEDAMPDFANLTPKNIVEVLGKVKLAPMVALSVIPMEKITSAVAAALLQNCSGNQVIVLYNWFSENGFLDVKAIRELFKNKVKEATTAVDRIDTLTRDAAAEDKDMMSDVRSAHRKAKADTGKFGKVYMHIDFSGSMDQAIKVAMEKGAIFAECIDNPAENFGWGGFTTSRKVLPLPKSFKREGFHAALYGIKADGGTDCYACYEEARKFGANVDVFLTDEGHHCAPFGERVKKFHETHPDISKPMAVVIVHFKTGDQNNLVEVGFKENGIPVAMMTPESLSESALVAQSVNTAMKGELALVEEVMNTPLPTLPAWWGAVERSNRVVADKATV